MTDIVNSDRLLEEVNVILVTEILEFVCIFTGTSIQFELTLVIILDLRHTTSEPWN